MATPTSKRRGSVGDASVITPFLFARTSAVPAFKDVVLSFITSGGSLEDLAAIHGSNTMRPLSHANVIQRQGDLAPAFIRYSC